MKYYTDGYTIQSNPSQIGGGYTIVDDNNELVLTKSIDKIGMTNNEAELLGMYECLLNCPEIETISTDSQVIHGWIVKGMRKKCPRKDLEPLVIKCRDLLREKRAKIIWEGRDDNLAGIYNDESGLDVLGTKWR
jgi:ribonuclease HI